MTDPTTSMRVRVADHALLLRYRELRYHELAGEVSLIKAFHDLVADGVTAYEKQTKPR